MPARREPSTEETLPDDDGRRLLASAPELALPHLFVALECDRPHAGVARYSLANVEQASVGRGGTRSSSRSFRDDHRLLKISIPDPRMSLEHVRLLRQGPGFVLHDLESRNGTCVNGKRATAPISLEDGDRIQVGRTMLRYRAAISVPVGEPADMDLRDSEAALPLTTIHPSLSRQAAALGRVARTAMSVLILGETGTGKEVLARALHRLSSRGGPFVPVNCGAIPAALVEAQLFGHLRGAFSGAVCDGTGLLRSAHGGTLLLDEVGDLPLPAQAALLRVLQDHEVVPVGGVRGAKVDLRVVAATHRPLETMAARGDFRSDLFARLAAYTFRLPPLRERREDIGLMVAAFARERPIRLMPAAASVLLKHDWPLNVRELHQSLEVAAVLADGKPIGVGDLPTSMFRKQDQLRHRGADTVAPELLYERVVASFVRHRGNVTDVARELGKGRKQVQRWMKRFGIEARSFRA